MRVRRSEWNGDIFLDLARTGEGCLYASKDGYSMREVSSGGRGKNGRANTNVVAATMRKNWGRRKMDSGKSKTKGKKKKCTNEGLIVSLYTTNFLPMGRARRVRHGPPGFSRLCAFVASADVSSTICVSSR
jgi:hypothetical protein